MRLVPISDLSTCRIPGISQKQFFSWVVATPLSIAHCAHLDGEVTPRGPCVTCARAEDTILTQSDHLAEHPTPLEPRASGPLAGTVRVPGDKSISHRAFTLR